MKRPPTIKSKRLLLVPIEPDERVARTMIGWLRDPEITKYSEQRHKKHTIRSQISYIRSTNKTSSRLYGIYPLTSVSLIGSISAHFDIPNAIANVGMMIGDKENMGKGYGYEAWESLCVYLLGCGLRKIEAGCMSINRPMMSICSKYGMMEEGRLEDHFIIGNDTCDLVHWGKMK